MEHHTVPSPVELDESGWRGRLIGVIKISAKAGFATALLLATVVGLIIYGISTAGHRRPSGSDVTEVTKPPEQQTPWWNAVPDAKASPPQLPTLPNPGRILPPGKATTSSERVPEIQSISATRTRAVQVEHEREEHRHALLEAAQTAPTMVRLNGTQLAPSNSTQRPLASQGLAASHAPLQSQDQNQDGSFLASVAAGTARDRMSSVPQDDPSPYELRAGSLIPATLLTGISANLPGTILGQVRTDVFDSVTGRYLLVPRGTRLVGTYDNRVAQGQRRVLVMWTRLLYPDGSSLDLLGMAGIDPGGYAGFGATVDEHLNKAFTSALLLSIIGAGAQLSQPQQAATTYAAPGIGQTIAGAVGQQIGNTSVQLTQRQLEMPPTLDVPPGYLFDVLVDRDIVLAGPYSSGTVR